MTSIIDRKIDSVKSDLETGTNGKLNDLETKLRA
jgi:hypothetical protein